jgi:error-prone DNA polymerase
VNKKRQRSMAEPANFAELVAATNFSFLRGASHPSDMIGRAMDLGLTAIGIADRNSVAGVVRAYCALRDFPEKQRAQFLEKRKERGEPLELSAEEEALCTTNLRLLVGARLVFADGSPDIVAYPATRYGWGRLTRLLTTGNLKAIKGNCILRFEDLLDHLDDLLLIVLPGSTAEPQEEHRKPVEYDFGEDTPKSHLKLVAPGSLRETLVRLSAKVPNNVWLGVTMGYHGTDRRRLAEWRDLATSVRVPLIATNDALYAAPEQRSLHDVLTSIRLGTTVANAGRQLEANAERHIKSANEMRRLFKTCPEAVEQTLVFADRIGFTLDQLSYEYPHEPVPPGWKPTPYLLHLVKEAAKKRYGEDLPKKVRRLLAEEIWLIRKRNYAYYFLTVHDLVKFARSQTPPILCQGRGSAANSIVCFLLGVTSVDPMKHDLLFSRFVSEDRNEPPDIDVDFEHERREEVMQYIYDRYGRHRAGIAATVIHYRSRSAVREVSKALGLSEDIAARLSSTIWGSYASDMPDRRFTDTGFDVGNPEIMRLRFIMEQLLEAPFPRHLSQHVGGFVLTQNRLDETVPILNAAMKDRSFIEWDKDDIDALGLMKVDVLALGMLTCIRKCFDLLRQHGLGDHSLEIDIEANDKDVYEMLKRGRSIGVFQVESRAQMSMLPRLKPENLYDLTVQVAIVRPGPIQGNMVHPYLRRRSGKEKPEFPKPKPPHNPNELRSILGQTYGVPLFQEQAMKLAIVAANFTPSEANQLRRAMATFRNVGTIHKFEAKMVEGMVKRGYERDFAKRCYEQIKGFGSYGFPESHALSFARLVYVSSWLKCHHPAVFACGLLNSQPMGFYAPAQIIRDAQDPLREGEPGVDVRPIDVNASCWDNILEPGEHGLALRIGFRQIDGFREDWGKKISDARADGPFTSIEELARRAHLPSLALRLLADADAWGSIGQGRRDALWEVRRTPSDELPLFAAASARELGQEEDAELPTMPLSEEVVADYELTRLSLKGHPMQFLRPRFKSEGVLSCAEVSKARNGSRATVAGVVLVRQRPGTGNAIFITLEDETGITNALLWARVFETQRLQVMGSRLMTIEGEVQRSAPSEGSVVHLIGARVIDRTADLGRLSEDHVTPLPTARVDFELSPDPRYTADAHGRHPRNVRILPKSRDFH